VKNGIILGETVDGAKTKRRGTEILANTVTYDLNLTKRIVLKWTKCDRCWIGEKKAESDCRIYERESAGFACLCAKCAELPKRELIELRL
jgi:hypothetical protein